MYSIFRDAKLQREVNSKTKRERKPPSRWFYLYVCIPDQTNRISRMNYIEHAAKIKTEKKVQF